MSALRAVRVALCSTLVLLVGAAPATAVPPDPVDDGNGRKWRQLYMTTGVSWNQVAAVCPRDGVNPCQGSAGGKDLSGWVWGTADQVVELMGAFEPAILAADPPSISSGHYFLSAATFLGQMRATHSWGFHYQFGSSASGWTASTAADGSPIGGGVAYGTPPSVGSFAVGTGGTATEVSAARGVWLWRPAGADFTPPVITPTVSGTLRSNGWYASDATVRWTVQDAESAVSSSTGCDTANVTTDTAGTTFRCEATSDGGVASASVTIKRDVTAPTVTCTSPPQVFEIYQLGAGVRAAVTDATSGPLSPVAQAAANTSRVGTFLANLTGTDRAGNRTVKPCAYQVVIPTCNGLQPTIVGTGGSNTITGTSGRDVIVALAHNDTINGGAGDDVICGNDGGDTIYGGDGSDWIDGGASPDNLNGGNGDDFIDGGLNIDSIRGDGGFDTCRSGEERMSSCEA